MTDPVLGVIVGALVLIDLLVCLLWTSVDPLRSTQETRIETSQETELPVIVTPVCRSEWEVYWVSVLLGYKCVLIVCSTVLAMLTKIKKNGFQTRNIIMLAYLFAVIYGLGIPIYTIAIIIRVHVSIVFVISCVVNNAIMYVCLFALFLPSVIPLIREKVIKDKHLA